MTVWSFMSPDRYCLLLDIPKAWYAKADYTFASLFGGNLLYNVYEGPIVETTHVWASFTYDILTVVGAGLGTFILSIRAYKYWRDRHHKD